MGEHRNQQNPSPGAQGANVNLPRKIMVVDNDQGVLTAVKTMLKPFGINVVEAKDWETALYLFNQNKFDLCLIELELEGMNGLTMVQKWREHGVIDKRDTAFLIMAGMQRRPQDDALIHELEDLTVVNKPITLPILLSLMATGMKKEEQRVKMTQLSESVIAPFLAQGQVDEALDIAKTKLEPLGPKGMFMSALTHEAAGRPEQALAIFAQLVQQDPNNMKYYNEIGRIHLAMGNLKGAKDAYEHADKIAPLNMNRVAAMAEMYLMLKQPDKSIEKFEDVLQTNPENSEIKFDMYERLIKEGFEQHAQEFCHQTSTPKELIRHFNNKGVVHSKTLDHNKALSEYQKALKLIPESKDVYRIIYNMAISNINLKTKDHIQKAHDLLEDCLKLAPDYQKAIDKLAMTKKYLQGTIPLSQIKVEAYDEPEAPKESSDSEDITGPVRHKSTVTKKVG